MTLAEVWPTVDLLPADVKLQLAHRILGELVKAPESTLLDPNVEYPIWRHYDSYEAAATLTQLLVDAKSKT